jgi:hypothetical protein
MQWQAILRWTWSGKRKTSARHRDRQGAWHRPGERLSVLATEYLQVETRAKTAFDGVGDFRSSPLLPRAGKRFAEYIYQQCGAQKLPSGRRLPLRVWQGQRYQIVCCHMGRNAACR